MLKEGFSSIGTRIRRIRVLVLWLWRERPCQGLNSKSGEPFNWHVVSHHAAEGYSMPIQRHSLC